MLFRSDKETKSIKAALGETQRRRKVQIEYNTKHGITPTTTKKALGSALANLYSKKGAEALEQKEELKLSEKDLEKLKKEMLKAAMEFDFEKAASLRDRIKKIESLSLL